MRNTHKICPFFKQKNVKKKRKKDAASKKGRGRGRLTGIYLFGPYSLSCFVLGLVTFLCSVRSIATEVLLRRPYVVYM